MTVTTRSSKGTALTYTEMDTNLTHLNTLLTEYNNYEIDQWRLNSAFSSNDATVTDWERVDDATFAKIGTGMSESSGVFTFPRTGLWLVTVHINIKITGSDSASGVYLLVSTNSDVSNDTVALIYEGDAATANKSGAQSVLINVTDASTFRFKIQTTNMTASQIMGNTNYNRTSILFERKGPHQT